MTESKPAVSKTTRVFVTGLAVGLIVGGLAGVYIGAFTDAGGVPNIKPVSGKAPGAATGRDDAPPTPPPAATGSEPNPEEAPAGAPK